MAKISDENNLPYPKSASPLECPITLCLKVIGGKWKPLILFFLKNRVDRFSSLRKSIPTITKQILTKQLRELESDGMIERIIHSEVQPKVQYRLTATGESIFPVILAMKEWGEAFLRAQPPGITRLVKR